MSETPNRSPNVSLDFFFLPPFPTVCVHSCPPAILDFNMDPARYFQACQSINPFYLRSGFQLEPDPHFRTTNSSRNVWNAFKAFWFCSSGPLKESRAVLWYTSVSQRIAFCWLWLSDACHVCFDNCRCMRPSTDELLNYTIIFNISTSNYYVTNAWWAINSAVFPVSHLVLEESQ